MTFNWRTPACWALAAILGWSGVLKALDPAAFAENILGFRLVPWPVAAALACYLPWLELVAAAALVVPRWRPGALVVACGLFGLFSAVWALTWARGIDVRCGCFGGGGESPAPWGLARAAALAVLAVLLLRPGANASRRAGR